MGKEKTPRANYTFRYEFNREELEEKSKQLAKCCEERNRLEDEKKSVTSEFKSKIDGKSAEINVVSGHINSGFEYLTKTCDVEKDFDKGVKTFIYEGVVVGREKMTPADYQIEAELN